MCLLGANLECIRQEERVDTRSENLYFLDLGQLPLHGCHAVLFHQLFAVFIIDSHLDIIAILVFGKDRIAVVVTHNLVHRLTLRRELEVHVYTINRFNLIQLRLVTPVFVEHQHALSLTVNNGVRLIGSSLVAGRQIDHGVVAHAIEGIRLFLTIHRVCGVVDSLHHTSQVYIAQAIGFVEHTLTQRIGLARGESDAGQ